MNINIYTRYICMKKQNKVTLENVDAYFTKDVTKFGSGAKIDCPKQYLGKKAHIIIKTR